MQNVKPLSPDSESLTLPEASTMLRLRPSTLRAWILHRKIVHLKDGSRVLFRRIDLEALINASIVPAARIAMRAESLRREERKGTK